MIKKNSLVQTSIGLLILVKNAAKIVDHIAYYLLVYCMVYVCYIILNESWLGILDLNQC